MFIHPVYNKEAIYGPVYVYTYNLTSRTRTVMASSSAVPSHILNCYGQFRCPTISHIELLWPVQVPYHLTQNCSGQFLYHTIYVINRAETPKKNLPSSRIEHVNSGLSDQVFTTDLTAYFINSRIMSAFMVSLGNAISLYYLCTTVITIKCCVLSHW